MLGSKVIATMSQAFLTAEWRYLAMLNYEIEPAVLRSLVPPGTELDSWNGRTLASMVGFLFLNTRVRGLSIPFHRNFAEVNLRFYVRRKGPDGWRRGVVFVKEIVPGRAIAAVDRVFYGEPYIALPMRHDVEEDAGGVSARYEWQFRGRWHSLRVKAASGPQTLSPGSEEEFITEHYWGYTAHRDGGTIEYQVEHPRWRVWSADESGFKCDIAALYGSRFVECLNAKARSAFLAEGSAVTVHQAMRI